MSQAEVSTQTVQTGEYQTFLSRSGEGQNETILFIHGSGPGASAWSNWQFILPALGDRFDCLAPDLLGFAGSSHPDPPPSGVTAWMELWVAQLIALLDTLNLEKVLLVGNSLGGAVALHLVQQHPERFGRVALMGAAGAPHTMTPHLDSVWGFYDNPTPEHMGQLINYFAYDPQSTLGGDLQNIARMRTEAALTPDVRRSFEAMFPAPRQRHVDALTLPQAFFTSLLRPVLLIHGRDDSVVPPDTSFYMLQHLPQAQLHLFGRCSHWTMIEYKQAFNELVGLFFERKI